MSDTVEERDALLGLLDAWVRAVLAAPKDTP